MRIWSARLFIVASAAVACSTGTGGKSANAPIVTSEVNTQNLQTAAGEQYNLSTRVDKNVIVSNILAPIDSVWRVVPGVFLELGVDPSEVNQKEHVIANTGFKVRRTLGGIRLSKYVECGSTVMGPNADQMPVIMSVTVQVVSDSAEISTLRTQVSGIASQDGTQTIQIACATTGGLESRIARMVNDDLAHRAKP